VNVERHRWRRTSLLLLVGLLLVVVLGLMMMMLMLKWVVVVTLLCIKHSRCDRLLRGSTRCADGGAQRDAHCCASAGGVRDLGGVCWLLCVGGGYAGGVGWGAGGEHGPRVSQCMGYSLATIDGPQRHQPTSTARTLSTHATPAR
jgi:hypothetical protein